ncbi:O-antigen ligase family protein [Candidatus Synechococcus spongiarum]|uniref:O-antigen ligase family protein n=1 Tax=Candidatus Synechococcus spongiarum TaxID=431041 RepID=UPI000470F11A|nr:O-antigen ligase family protein [Candidatus Synechococcus spongiarum]
MLTACLSRLQDHCPADAPHWGWVVVQLGLFFLASSVLLGGVLLVVGLVVATWRKGFAAYCKDRMNRLLLLVAGLILVGATQAVSGGFAWLGLFWLPFFWGFWGWQAYLETPAARRRCSGWLVAGTVPVLITGVGQMTLGWQGPWSMAGDLVIWQMDAGGNPAGRLSGIFGHANITAAWLALTWPLVLAHLLEPPLRWWKQSALLILAVLQGLCLWLTASRNGWGSLILAVPLVLAGPRSWALLLPVTLLGLIPVVLAILPVDLLGVQELARLVVPDALWQRFAAESFQGRAPGDTRLEMWGFSNQLILERPWLGWGAAAFGMLYPYFDLGNGHVHNLPLDLAVSFGLPAALLLLAVPIHVLVTAVRHGMATASITDRGWLVAFLSLAGIHATDLPYYDVNINVAGWFLLAGLRAYGLAAPQRRLTGAMRGGAQMECRFSNSN